MKKTFYFLGVGLFLVVVCTILFSEEFNIVHGQVNEANTCSKQSTGDCSGTCPAGQYCHIIKSDKCKCE
jgi:hypothetical protein